MLTELCKELRNYFVKEVYRGVFTIKNGSIVPLDFLQDGQYFTIVGSVFNDGVHKYPTDVLIDETFDGTIRTMAVPPAFIALSEEIKVYKESEPAKPSAYTSESFGGYTYTKATDKNGVPASWEKVFADRLNEYRKI